MEQESKAFRGLEQPSPGFRSLEHALDVLCACAEKDEIGVSELARRLRLQQSGVHRIVRTLAARGFVEQRANRRYCLGIKVLELGNAYRLRLDLVRKAEPILRELSRHANANTHLARLEHGEVLDLFRVEYPLPLRVSKSPLLRRPPHCTALGKVLLAHGSLEQVNELFQRGIARLTRKTITQPERLLQELSRVRERGYAVDNEEFCAGVRCVAAPVFNENGEAVAAISISALITHLTEDRIPQFAGWVMQAAADLSHQLGYRAMFSGNAGREAR